MNYLALPDNLPPNPFLRRGVFFSLNPVLFYFFFALEVRCLEKVHQANCLCTGFYPACDENAGNSTAPLNLLFFQ